jgi:dTMP kinase
MLNLNPYQQFRGNYPGKFIVLDSGPAVGKSTQVEELCKRIGSTGRNVAQVTLPRYEKGPWGKLIRDYLGRRLGETNEIHYKLASALYAGDRLEFKPELLELLQKGVTVVASRYVASNMAYQGAKIDDPEELVTFLNWLTHFEYEHNHIPVEDAVIVQYAPAVITLGQAEKRAAGGGEGADGHESSIAHVDKISDLYVELAAAYKGWYVVNCHDRAGSCLKPIDQTADDIWKIVEPILLAA